MNQALLVIDAQQSLIDGSATEKPVFAKEQLIENINRMVKKATDENIPIVFVRDLDVAEGEGEGFQVHRDINVPASAEMIDKKSTSAFHKTTLLNFLKNKEVGHVVIMGCATGYCIDTAVRAATVNQFDVTLVKEGHSTADSEVLSGEQIINHHNDILHGHYNVDNFCMVRSVEEDLFKPPHDTHR